MRENASKEVFREAEGTVGENGNFRKIFGTPLKHTREAKTKKSPYPWAFIPFQSSGYPSMTVCASFSPSRVAGKYCA